MCGCNVSDVDNNKNGVADCLDPTASTQPSRPIVDITRTTPDNETARYQLLAKLQSVSGTVLYSVLLRNARKTIAKTTSKPIAIFGKLDRGSYELSYSMTIGAGTGQQTTKTTAVTVKIPGGTQSSQRRLIGASREQERR
jgi:hypothetical protein